MADERALERVSTGIRGLDIVLDLNALGQASVYPTGIGGFLSALVSELRALGVTTVLTEESPGFVAAESPRSGMSLMADNIVLLRYVELRGRLHRFVSVLKMRQGGHYAAIREFRFTCNGIDFFVGFEGAEAIIGGFADKLPETGVQGWS